MSKFYNLLCLSVGTAQSLRSSDGEDHSHDCLHLYCVEDRVAREMMRELPEHKEKQTSWVTFMNELIFGSKKYDSSVIEDDEYEQLLKNNVTA